MADTGSLAAIEMARRRADLELRRADNAAEMARRHEVLVRVGRAQMRDFHARAAALQRRMEARHRAAAHVHLGYAQRLEGWANRAAATVHRPTFMTAVADTAGSRGAVLTLFDADNTEALIAASDATARAAHELESTFAEGPSRDALCGHAVVNVCGPAVPLRWPHYGPALHELGVQGVAAVALRVSRRCLGTLTVFDPDASTASAPALDDVGEALTHRVFLDPEPVDAGGGVPALEWFGDDDFRPALHQAAGMLKAWFGWSISDATAVIRGHAFAEGRPVGEVAEDIVRGALRLS